MPPFVRLPPVGWVFVHPLVINRAQQGTDAVVDAEGRWTSPVTNLPADGYLANVGEKEIEWAASRGVEADAVAVFPRSVGIDASDGVTATGVDVWLDGTYRIVAVRATPVHVRCLLKKMRGVT